MGKRCDASNLSIPVFVLGGFTLFTWVNALMHAGPDELFEYHCTINTIIFFVYKNDLLTNVKKKSMINLR